jgi:imidazolonepropionase-like amidohydrolase
MLRVALGLCLGAALCVGVLAWGLRPPRLAVPDAGLVLHDVTLVEPGRGRRPGQTLALTGDRIAAVGDSGGESGPYSGAFVLPGLVDLHVHYPPPWALGERRLYALLFLAHGVTSVRDTGSVLGDLFAFRERIAEGKLAGPRIRACGPVLAGPSAFWPGARSVEDAASGRRAVEALARAGADCIKVYNGVPGDAVAAIRDTTAEYDLPLVAHVPYDVSIAQLEGAEVQHLMGLTRRWWRVDPERLAWYARTSAERRIAHTPTLVAFARTALLREPGALETDPLVRLLPRHYRETLWNPERNPLAGELAPSWDAPAATRVAVMKQVLRTLREAGVTILAGSDTGDPLVGPGAALHEELRQLVDAGLPLEEVWVIATRRAGEVLGVAGLGTLAEGAPADLLVFREDPTRDLAALDSLEAVVAAGRPYPRQVLDAALERQRAHLERPWIAGPAGLLARAVAARNAPQGQK